MNIVTELKRTVFASTGYTLHYGGMEELNVELDTATFPAAYGVAVEGSTIDTDGGRLREKISVVVAFVDLQTSENSDDVEITIDQMKEKAMAWLAYLRGDDAFDVVTIGQAGRIYHQFDGILCGYSVNVTLRERVGYCLRYEEEEA